MLFYDINDYNKYSSSRLASTLVQINKYLLFQSTILSTQNKKFLQHTQQVIEIALDLP